MTDILSSTESASQMCLCLDVFRVLVLTIHVENESVPDGAVEANSSSSAEWCVIWSG